MPPGCRMCQLPTRCRSCCPATPTWRAGQRRPCGRRWPPSLSPLASGRENFERYGGGVWQAARCPLPGGAPTVASAQMNHAVLVIGYDMTASPPYWLLKNSWGTGWGEGGYFKLEMLDDNTYGTCSMYTAMTKPTDVIISSVPPSPPAEDDNFSNADAAVVCTQLGYGSSGTAVPNAGLGQGTGQIWLDEGLHRLHAR
ncbi:hypothetical protein ABPG75_013812 [Micractinium tetrahymenae]